MTTRAKKRTVKRTTTKRTTKSPSKRTKAKSISYKDYTPAKLLSTARRWQNKLVSFSKATAKKKFNGKTLAAHKAEIQKEMKKVASYLGRATTKQIKDKIKMLKTQMAKTHKIKASSSKAISPAVKKLTAKYKEFKKSSKNAIKLIKLHTGFKLSSFKNPKSKRKTKTTGVRKKTTTKSRTTLKSRTRTTSRSTAKKRSGGLKLKRKTTARRK